MEMTKQVLKEACKKDKLYSTFYLNDRLYLHYKGFRSISCLEEFTGLKVLWLEGNAIAKIEGLETQEEMATLYLHENIIDKIEGLDKMVRHPLTFSLPLSAPSFGSSNLSLFLLPTAQARHAESQQESQGDHRT